MFIETLISQLRGSLPDTQKKFLDSIWRKAAEYVLDVLRPAVEDIKVFVEGYFLEKTESSSWGIKSSLPRRSAAMPWNIAEDVFVGESSSAGRDGSAQHDRPSSAAPEDAPLHTTSITPHPYLTPPLAKVGRPLPALQTTQPELLRPLQNLFVSFANTQTAIDHWHALSSMHTAAETHHAMLTNSYDFNIEIHSRDAYFVTCQREMQRVLVRALQGVQTLKELTLIGTRVVKRVDPKRAEHGGELEIDVENQTVQWWDNGRWTYVCHRAFPTLQSRVPTNHSAEIRRILSLPEVEWEMVLDLERYAAGAAGRPPPPAGEDAPDSLWWTHPVPSISRFNVLQFLTDKILTDRNQTADIGSIFFAEIGTREGETPLYLMPSFPCMFSLIVDIFFLDTTGAELFARHPGHAAFIQGDSTQVTDERIDRQFWNRQFWNKVKPKQTPRGCSAPWSASASSDPHKFDLIFLDGDHSYQGVQKDIDNWYPRLVPGGILAGHDFDIQWYGVVLAVLDFVQKERLKLYLSVDAVWWVEKT